MIENADEMKYQRCDHRKCSTELIFTYFARSLMLIYFEEKVPLTRNETLARKNYSCS